MIRIIPETKQINYRTLNLTAAAVFGGNGVALPRKKNDKTITFGKQGFDQGLREIYTILDQAESRQAKFRTPSSAGQDHSFIAFRWLLKVLLHDWESGR